MRLTELPRRVRGVVERVEARSDEDATARRLRDLGFVAGEEVRITATGPFGAEPLLVQVGYTRFALRRDEAARVVLVEADTGTDTDTDEGEARSARTNAGASA